MTPLFNGNPTAAELDRAIKGQEVYDAALAEGKTADEALELAKAFMREYAKKQFLRSVGVEDD